MAKKKKSNKIVPVLVFAAILGGGYYWLTSGSPDEPGLHLPGEGVTDTEEVQPEMEDDADATAAESDNLIQNQDEETVTPEGLQNETPSQKQQVKKPVKNAYTDEYGNVIYTQPHGTTPIKYAVATIGRWGYTLRYPSFLTKQSTSSDGRTFENTQKRCKLATYANWNVFDETISELYRKDFPEVKSITYKKLFRKENFYVKSGYTNDNRIFYLKEAIYKKDGQEVIATLVFYYPTSYKKEADKVIKATFGSFPIRK